LHAAKQRAHAQRSSLACARPRQAPALRAALRCRRAPKARSAWPALQPAAWRTPRQRERTREHAAHRTRNGADANLPSKGARVR
jgi:hypothetical protein